MLEMVVFVYMTFGDRWEKFEKPLPPQATREECMALAEDLARFAILLSENKSKVQYGCRQDHKPI